MDANTVVNKFKEIREFHGIQFDLKKEQIDIAVSVLKGRSVLCILPTGFGKTLCFVLPTMIDSNPNSITLVISPLTFLIDDHIQTLTRWNFRCSKISPLNEMDERTITGIKQGKFQFVFSSLESALEVVWKNIYISKTWQKNLILIVVDEAHCISEWGPEFRVDYQKLHELRSFFRTPVMALTATPTLKIKDDIMKYLNLSEDETEIVYKIPDRPNLFLYFKKRVLFDHSENLMWLIDHIKEKGVHAKKSILYCRSIDAVSEIFMTMRECLGSNAYVNGVRSPENLLIEMYHKSTHQDSKDRILANFKDNSSTIRCVIATVAMGMGVDIRDIDMVIHVGCPKSVISYWQEAGRCARDGRKGISLVLYDNFTLALKTTSDDIACIAREKDNKCIRREILRNLSIDGVQIPQTNICSGCCDATCICSACLCCSLCRSLCKCDNKDEDPLQIYMQ